MIVGTFLSIQTWFPSSLVRSTALPALQNLAQTFGNNQLIRENFSRQTLFLVFSHSVTDSIFDGSTEIPFSDTTCPKNFTSFIQNSHLEYLAYSLLSLST